MKVTKEQVIELLEAIIQHKKDVLSVVKEDSKPYYKGEIYALELARSIINSEERYKSLSEIYL